MDEREWLTERFEQHRPQLRAVAYRMLGSVSESDDALQEAWLRIRNQDPATVENMQAWLTTVVGRVCLNMLRSRAARREEPSSHVPDPVVGFEEDDPEHEALLADSVGLALLVVLARRWPGPGSAGAGAGQPRMCSQRRIAALYAPRPRRARPLAGASRPAALPGRVSGLPGGLSRSSPSAPLPVAGAVPWPPRPSPARSGARCPADLPAGRVPSGMCRCQVWAAAAPAWPCSQWQHCMDQ